MTGAPLHVAIMNSLTGGNPYMRRLAESLEHAGCRVTATGQRAVFIKQFLKRDRPRVAHFHWIHVMIMDEGRPVRSRVKFVLFLLQLRLLRLLGVRIVWTAHDLHDHDQREKRLDATATGALARASDAIIAHCHTAKRMVLERFDGVDPDAVHVIPHANYDQDHGFETDRAAARAAVGLDDDTFCMLFFGNVRAYKGVVDLVRAFRDDDDPSKRLIIAGRPFRDEDEREVAAAAEGDPRIQTRFGYLPDDELDALLAACDLATLPYKNILTSGAAVLAMTFGRPVVAPAIGCFTDMFEQGGAILYDPEDPDGLRDALRDASERRAELPELGRQSRAAAAAVPWKRVGEQTREVFETALGQRPHAP